MSAAFQIIPYPRGETISADNHFNEDFSVLCKHLRDRCGGKLLEVFPPEIHNPYPIGITLDSFQMMKAASATIHRGIQALVKNYFSDPRLCQGLLQLSPRAQEVLLSVQHLPYNVGSWRPDFLFPSDDLSSFKICGQQFAFSLSLVVFGLYN